MKTTFLTSQHLKVSHDFVRREALAFERQGFGAPSRVRSDLSNVFDVLVATLLSSIVATKTKLNKISTVVYESVIARHNINTQASKLAKHTEA